MEAQELVSKSSKNTLQIKELRDEIQQVLDADFDTGSNYYASESGPFSEFNDTELVIEGLGKIEYPIRPEVVKQMIELATKAPYGRGERTVFDPDYRDTWQIEPSRVKSNLPYGYYIPATDVCEELDVHPERVRFELNKLLIYEKGSHFKPHQDSEKSEGMFGSMSILLPSSYEGGELHLRHGSRADVVDFSHESSTSVVILAWYTDVVHEIKPVTSGYRIALSYNLIHTSMESPRPHLASEEVGMSRLQAILNKWNYSDIALLQDDENMIIHILAHKYSISNLESGMKVLKGSDRSLVACLRAVAEGLNFRLYFAHLTFYLSGTGRDQPGLDDLESETGEAKPDDFFCIHRKELTINNLVDLDGNSIPLKHEIRLGDSNHIPKLYFKDAKPDDTQYEPYYGNDGNNLKHWYHLTALVLIPNTASDELFFYASGADYAMLRFKQLRGPPTVTDKELAIKLLKSPYLGKATLQDMADYAIDWRDSSVWKAAVEHSGYRIENIELQRIYEALKLFNFNVLRLGLEKIVSTRQPLQHRLTLIESLPAHVPMAEHPAVVAWCSQQAVHMFANLDNPTVEDTGTFINLTKEKGVEYLLQSILPQLDQMNLSFDFILSFMSSFHSNRSLILNESSTWVASQDANFDMVLTQCIRMAITAWKVATPSSWEYAQGPAPEHHIKRTLAIIDFCIITGHFSDMGPLFQMLMGTNHIKNVLGRLFVPILLQLSAVLRANGIAIDTPPFNNFIQTVVKMYFDNIPPLPPIENFGQIRLIGCGCIDCTALDSFIADTTTQEKEFELLHTQRHHAEDRLMLAEDLVVFGSIQHASRNPHGIKVQKLGKLKLTHEWEVRLTDAKHLLQELGKDEDLAKVVGDELQSMQETLTNIAHAVKGHRE